MALADSMRGILTRKLDELAQTIEGELKAECPKRSGEAARSIHIENQGEFARFVGGTNDHLFFADEGNNQTKTFILPKGKPLGANALRFTDGSIHASARTYEGKHFVKEVADRHR